ncbi:alpha/beta hydrolase [Roseobacter sp. YSTF-M11]|uniref:Alpha/beta hydrolase n=1 Tax=Roseobacter insulae TaxID=2859783 RepID=A0A9X1JWX2_9RHOB|nr:alpha/beta hydrolase [Roseobacter insulae]MBW4706620.1 alpha/beta hydrolase [Roseobacter insulae]
MIWVYLVIAAIVATPLIIEATRKRMTDAARANAPGDFATLSQGVTHFQWYGPSDGPVAVCVHGLTTPSFVWKGVAQGLARMGFRVLVYDLYGRGYSDRVRGTQDRAFFQKQLNELLDDQGVEDDITMIGYSMGGAIATIFAASQPDRILQLVLLAPAGMSTVTKGVLGFAARTPVIGTWLMLELYPAILRAGLKVEKDQPTSVEGINALQEAELNWRGFIPAVHASMRGMLSEDLQPDHATVQEAGIPVLAIWGRDDAVIPIAAAARLAEWNPDAQQAVIEDAGHGLPYSHTPDVLEHINAFTHQSG